MPIELLGRIDDTANAYYMSRAEYVRLVLHKAVTEHQRRETWRLLHEPPEAPPKGFDKNDPRLWDIGDS